ncbi:thioesterase-like superfamily-domain-containing protein [Aspergillus cavernicola]|uniref:Thioesterase-like superfamily-domain-containing protein n=1 Tax=Aspergillus cavernicola TaxID=176166 RepID=A0ABR4HG91_9EURO
MAEPCHSSIFEKAIAVMPIDANTYSAHLDPSWCIATVPHGGYTASILYRTAATHFAQKAAAGKNRPGRSQEPIGLQISFQRRTFAGPAIMTVQEIKLGARLSTIHVTLSQTKDESAAATKARDRDDELEVKVLAYITLSLPDIEESSSPVKGTWDLSPPSPPGSLRGGLINFNALAADGIDGDWKSGPVAPRALHAAKHLKLYSPSATLFPKTVEERATQVVDQWARLVPGGTAARWSNEAVVYLTDLSLAALDRLGAMERTATGTGEDTAKVTTGTGLVQFWYPTVSMNIDLKTRLPLQGVEWLHSRVVTRMLRGSRADLEVLILDQNGELVATSTQVALVVDPARNHKGRESSGKL